MREFGLPAVCGSNFGSRKSAREGGARPSRQLRGLCFTEPRHGPKPSGCLPLARSFLVRCSLTAALVREKALRRLLLAWRCVRHLDFGAECILIRGRRQSGRTAHPCSREPTSSSLGVGPPKQNGRRDGTGRAACRHTGGIAHRHGTPGGRAWDAWATLR